MDCRETSLLLQDYVERTLEPSAHAKVREHVASCEECRRDAQAYSVLFDALDAEPAEPAPQDLTMRIMAHIRQGKKPYSILGVTIPSWRGSDFALIAASLLLSVFFSYQLIQTHSEAIVRTVDSVWKAAASVEPDLQLSSVLEKLGGVQVDTAGLLAGASDDIAGLFQSFGEMTYYVGIPIGAALPFLAISVVLMFIGNLVCLSTPARRVR